MSIIVKLAGRYLEWSTIADAPLTNLMSRDEIRAFVGGPDIDKRLARVDAHGTSMLSTTDPETFVSCNRAGKNERRLTVAQLIAKYGATQSESDAPETK